MPRTARDWMWTRWSWRETMPDPTCRTMSVMQIVMVSTVCVVDDTKLSMSEAADASPGDRKPLTRRAAAVLLEATARPDHRRKVTPMPATNEPRKMIHDCDPGHDDAVAILMAVGHPAIELVGVTTIGGNQTLEKVTRNARTVLTIAGVGGVPVHAGCTRPLVREGVVAAEVHGHSGMDAHGYALPEPTVGLDDGHAVDFIIDTDVADFVVGLIGFFRQAYRENQGFDDPPVHDPCVVAYLIDPSVVSTTKVPLDVELQGALTAGMTVADFRAPIPADCTTQVAVTLDHGKFWDLVVEAITAAPGR